MRKTKVTKVEFHSNSKNNMSIKRIKFRLVALLAFCFIFSQAIEAQTPNIIVIVADDLGWSQVSTGKTNLDNPSDFYETPVIAQLAEEGISFPHAYVNGANCAPTRAALLGGQYASRPTNNVFAVYNLNRGNNASNSSLCGPVNGLGGGKDELPGSSITIAETLKTVGYTTAHFGKYHVGGSRASNTPEQQGFDYNFGGGSAGTPGKYFAQNKNGTWAFNKNILPQLDPYANPYSASESLILAGDNSLTGTPKHVTDALVEAALDFLSIEKSNPFFMYFSQYAVHAPYSNANARPDLLAKYQNKQNTNPSQMGHNSLGQGAILEGMDQAIGRLINYLKTTEDPRNPGKMLSQNTFVYFLSDNGGVVSSDDNGPLKGEKGDYTEGGIRAASVAWGPGILSGSGIVNHTPTIALDLYPTIAELAGADLPDNYAIDGVSLMPIINGTNPTMNRGAIYWHYPGYLVDNNRDSRPKSIIRKEDYKLIYTYESESYELYNLIEDMSETTNLLDGTPPDTIKNIAHELSTDLQNHLTQLDAPLPFLRDQSGKCSTTEADLPYIIPGKALKTKAFSPSENIKVYPNPFNDNINIIIENIQKAVEVEILNVLGQVVLKNTFNSTYIELKELTFPAGQYLLKLKIDNVISYKKLIK